MQGVFRYKKIGKKNNSFFFAYKKIKRSHSNLEKDPNNDLNGGKKSTAYQLTGCRTLNLLVEEHISLCVLDAGLRHLGHTLVIKFIPQIVHVVPAVRYVVATCDQREQRASEPQIGTNLVSTDFFFPSEGANECGTLALPRQRQIGQLTAGSAVVTDD